MGQRLLAAILAFELVLSPVPAAWAADQDGSTPRSARGRDVTTSQSPVSFDVMTGTSSGAATLSFPIEVAPGTNGVQPSVVLAYASSSRENTWVGKGWSLDFGAIERSTKRGIPEYGATDTYVLNGEPLVLKDGEYHTRRETFARIRRCKGTFAQDDLCAGRMPSAGEPWVVELPDGTVQRYGLTPESRIDTPKGTARWLLSEVYDPDGNVIVYRYSAAGDTGQRYPSEIRYTLRRSDGPRGELESLGKSEANDRVIQFVLENRDDPRLSYIGDYEERTTKRLARIQVQVPGTNGRRILRQYNLVYDQSWDNRASLLIRIEQRGLDGLGDPLVTTFAYTSNNPARCGLVGGAPCAPASDPSAPLFTNVTGAPYSLPAAVSFTTDDRLDGGVRIADVNADGRPDLVRAFVNEQQPAASDANGTYLNLRDAPTGFTYDSSRRLPSVPVTFNTRREGAFSILSTFSGADLITARQDGFLLADFTGDGRPDLLRAMDYTNLLTCSTSGPNPTPLARSQVRQFFEATAQGFVERAAPAIGAFALGFEGVTERPGLRFPAFAVSRGAAVAELDGDGLPDLIQAEVMTVVVPNPDPRRTRVGNNLVSDAWLNRGGGAFELAAQSDLSVCDTLGKCDNLGTLLETIGTQVVLTCRASPAQSLVGGGEPAGKRYLDVNGDRLDDFVSSLRDGDIMLRRVVLNEGARFGNSDASDRATREFGVPEGLFLDESVGGVFRDRGIRLFDVNGDGILDIVQAAEEPGVPSRTWLGTQIVGNPYVLRTERRAVPAGMMFSLANGLDRGVRDMDFDADGIADLIRLDGTPGGAQTFWRNDAVAPDLLAQVTNPLGGTQTFEYKSAAEQTDALGNPPGNNAQPLQVVSRMAMNSQVHLGEVATTFQYRVPLTDPDDDEFRGFRLVIASNALGVRTVTEFHQNIVLQGQPVERYVETSDGVMMQRESFQYKNEAALRRNAALPFPVQIEQKMTESFGPPEPGDNDRTPLTVVTTMSYDDAFGNVTSVSQRAGALHDVTPPLERKQEFTYATPSDDGPYIANRLATATIYKPGSSEVGARTLNYYDDSTTLGEVRTLGHLTRVVQEALEPDGTDLVTDLTYDDFGNVTERAGPGPQRMKIEYAEAALSTFPTKMEMRTNGDETLATAVAYSFELCPTPFPVAAGLPHLALDVNGKATGRCYDVRGRPTLESLPAADATQRPTTFFSYTDYAIVKDDNPVTPDFMPASMTVSRQSDTPGEMGLVRSKMLLDGFGRPYFTVADGARGQQIESFSLRNPLDQVVVSFLPAAVGTAFEDRLTTAFEYDLLGRVARTTAPGGRVTTTRELRGRTTVMDPNENVRVSIADGFGNVRRVLEYPEGRNGITVPTDYEYDQSDRLVRILPAPNGPDEPEVSDTEIEYNSLGQRIRLSDPDLGLVTSTYDAAGNLASETDAREETTYFEYDAANRLLRSGTELDEDGKLVADQILTYDEGTAAENGLGNLTSVEEDPDTPDARTHYFRYDELGRRIWEEHILAGKRFRFTQTFDRLGALKSRTFPGPSDDAPLARLETLFDAKGFVTEIQETVSGTVLARDFDFDERLRLTGFTTDNDVRTTTEFNPDTDLLERMKLEKTSAPSLNESLRYRLDAGGLVREIVDEIEPARSRTFVYDPLNRLTSSTGPWGASEPPTTLGFAYDIYGNLTEKDGQTRTYGGDGVPPHAIATLGDQTFEYDATGNLTAIKSANVTTRGYVWNERGKLEAVRGPSGGELATYLYDQTARRIRAKEGGTTRWFVTEDFEWDQTAKQASIYVTGPGGRLASFTQPFDPPAAQAAVLAWLDQNVPTEGALAGLILLPLLLLLGLCAQLLVATRQARLRPSLANATLAVFWLSLCAPSLAYAAAQPAQANLSELRFFHSDQLGSTTLQTDATGTIVLRTLYRPFGEAEVDEGELPRFAFNGQRYEERVGLYDYGARFYDPKLGRFLSPDPVVPEPGDPQSLNRYSYVRNNPINRIDPSGNVDILGVDNVGTRAIGLAGFVFGGLAFGGSVAFGVVSSPTVGGAALGVAGAALSADGAQAGLRQFLSGQPQATQFATFLNDRVGLSSGSAVAVELASNILTGRPLSSADDLVAIAARFNGTEQAIVSEAKAILVSSQLAELRAAQAAGSPLEVAINGRKVLFEPDLPSSGFTFTSEDAFILGNAAFKTDTELAKTVLQELFRLRVGEISKGGGLENATSFQSVVSAETDEAFQFAERAFDFFFGSK